MFDELKQIAEEIASIDAHRGITREMVLFFSVVGFITCCIILGVIVASVISLLVKESRKNKQRS